MLPYCIRANKLNKSEISTLKYTLKLLKETKKERVNITSREIASQMRGESVITSDSQVDKAIQPVFKEANIRYYLFNATDKSLMYSIPLNEDQRARINRLYDELLLFRQRQPI